MFKIGDVVEFLGTDLEWARDLTVGVEYVVEAHESGRGYQVIDDVEEGVRLSFGDINYLDYREQAFKLKGEN